MGSHHLHQNYIVWRVSRRPHAHPESPVQAAAFCPPCPTFDRDDMLPDLVLQLRLVHLLEKLVDGVDVRVDGLEPLDLGSDGGRVGQMLLVVHGFNSKMDHPPSGCFSVGEGSGTQKWNLWPPAGGDRQRKSLRSGFFSSLGTVWRYKP